MEKFESDDIVKDLKVAAPTSLLKVKYGTVELEPGRILTPTQVQNEPVIEWSANPIDYYTVIMSDPDAPSRAEPKFKEVLHWSVVNIPGDQLSAGQVLSFYVGSGPLEGSGHHRYIFLVFKQQSKSDILSSLSSLGTHEERINFSTADFVKKHQLGDPVAGNYYLAEYDDYVPILREKMSIPE